MTETDYTKSFIFQSHFVDAILEGRKTETRRICKNLPRVGRRSRFVTQRGGNPFATARIRSLRIERLGDMTAQDAFSEGCPDEFLGKPIYWFTNIIWLGMHDKWHCDQEVFVITWDKLEAA